jgi:RimJ/RimL family protein N-acetyltransferase
MTCHYSAVEWPQDAELAIDFLVASEWPFHGTVRLSPEQAAELTLVAEDVISFWIRDGDDMVGLIRVFDLDDIEDGSPLFDLRVAAAHRGRGIGQAALGWMTHHLFSTYADLHRIEATTRHDNVAMQHVFDSCGYRQEGRFVEAWKNEDGTWSDTFAYAMLRREWEVTQ